MINLVNNINTLLQEHMIICGHKLKFTFKEAYDPKVIEYVITHEDRSVSLKFIKSGHYKVKCLTSSHEEFEFLMMNFNETICMDPKFNPVFTSTVDFVVDLNCMLRGMEWLI